MLKNKIQDFIKKKTGKENKKSIENLVVFLILLIITVIAINTIWKKDEKQEDKSPSYKVFAEETKQESNILEETEYDLEKRLEDILYKMTGVGKVKVLVTYSQTSSIIPMYSETESTSLTEETDSGGGTRKQESSNINKKSVDALIINAGAYINAQNSTGITPLAEAVSAGNLEMAELLLDNGADVNACDTKGKSILSFAVQTQNINAVNLLLKNNADLYIQEFDGKNAFHEAVLTENVEIIRKIQQSGGDALSRDKNGTTPFALSLTKSEDIIRAVVGKNKNLTDSDGNTLMHIAVANNAKVAVINELISENYPFDTRNSSGVTPLYLAAETNQLASVDALLSGGANPFTASGKKDGCTVSLALQKNDQLLLNTILKYAAHKTDMQGNTILHYAAKLSNAETVKKLLAADINPAVKNIAGETAYNIAVNWQKTEIAQLLKQ